MGVTKLQQLISVHFKCSDGNKCKILVLQPELSQYRNCQRRLPKIGVISNNDSLKISVANQVVFLGKAEHVPEVIDLQALDINY